MRRPPVRSIVVLLLIAIVATPIASAQRLRLGDPKPPELGASSYAFRRAFELRAEVDRLPRDDATANADSAGVILDASRRAWRQVAATWLSAATSFDRAGIDDDELESALIVAGHRLADAGPTLDAWLNSLEANGDFDLATREAALWGLRRFNERAATLDANAAPPKSFESLDAHTRRFIRPLFDAVLATAPDATPYSGWTLSSQPPEPSSRLAATRDRINQASIDDAVRAAALSRLNELETAQSFRIAWPDLDAALTDLESLTRVAEVTAAADWLGAGVVSDLITLLAEATALVGDDEARAANSGRLRRLEFARRIIESTATLRGATGRDRIALRALEELITNLDVRAVDTAALVRLRLLADILDGFIEFRTMSESKMRLEMRRAHKLIEDAYREVEQELLDQLRRLEEPREALSDPDFLSLNAKRRTLLGDMRRLRSVDQWIERMADGDRAIERDLTLRLVALAEALANPMTRPDAADQLAAFDNQASRFLVLPLEERINSNDATTLRPLESLALRLPTIIREKRNLWILAWARRPDAVPGAAAEVEALERFLAAHRASLRLDALGDSPASLNAWAPWYLDASTIAAGRSRLERGRDGIAPLVDRGGPPLIRALDELDRDAGFALAVASLLDQAPVDGDRSATSLAGRLSPLVYPPSSGAPLLAARGLVSRLVRWQTEDDHPAPTRSRDERRELAAYLEFASERVRVAADAAGMKSVGE
ncbi:MAG: hypothetical protein ACF8PN_07500 [Phycisphaerales bacterium]